MLRGDAEGGVPANDSERLELLVMHKLTHKDIEGLPLELLRELKATRQDQRAADIQRGLAEMKVASLDHLIIWLYRNTNIVHKRREIRAKLDRMTKENLVEKCGKNVWRLCA